MAPLVGALANIARETDAALVLQHHRSTKGRAAPVRGSSSIEDQADVVFTLGRREGRHELAARKNRLGRHPEPIPLRWREEPPGFLSASTRATKVEQLAERVGELADVVRESGSWPLAEIAVALDLDPKADTERKRLQRALRLLREAGQWEDLDHGRYRPVTA